MSPGLLAALYVGLGGFLGAIARYLLSLASAGFSLALPWGTLLSNALGCFALGVIVALAGDGELIPPGARLFLATGFCGGFTTMSSFVYELAQYARTGELMLAAFYLGATLAGSFTLFYAGLALVRVARG